MPRPGCAENSRKTARKALQSDILVPLTSEQRQLAEHFFAEAIALSAEERDSFLEQHCEDAEVRREVASLLRYSGGPLTGAAEVIKETAAAWAAPDFAGVRVGAYRITGRIGQGGMGAVYRAVRDDDQFHKTVAIKMLRFTAGDEHLLQRFLRERQILASLEHPSIARLLDGGAWFPPGASEPQPYIVMEYVEGRPLDSYCAENNVPLRERLALFREVCEALSYAHRQLIVHRDIKPSNILVTKARKLKLLDFGVAKLLDRGPETRATATTGVLALTPDYASPEQVRCEAVSTLTDVYSLGVALYELLTGRRPHRFSSHDPLEIAREICEREADPPRVNPDLDTIVLKALQKEPSRRYSSVDQLSEDIRRYLEGLPLIARPDTMRYRAAKFVRRNRLGVAAAAALAVSLAGGIVASAWEARRALQAQKEAQTESELARSERDRALEAQRAAVTERNRAQAAEQSATKERNNAVVERQRADSEAASAKAVTEFLAHDLLGQASPNAQVAADMTVRKALDRAAEQLESKFAGKPLVEAAIRETMSDTYREMGLFSEAQKQVERAWELRRVNLGERHLATLNSMNSMAIVMRLQGRLADAEKLYERILAIRIPLLGEKDRDTLVIMGNLAVVYNNQSKYAQAEALNLRVLEIQKRLLGPEHLDTLRTMNNLGSNYTREGKFAQAESVYKQVLEIRRRVQGPEHPNTLFTMNNLASVYGAANNFAPAEELMKQLLEIQRRALGPEHPDTLLAQNTLGMLAFRKGDFATAERILSENAVARTRVLGARHMDTLEVRRNLGAVQLRLDKFTEAEAILRATHEDLAQSGKEIWQRDLCSALLGTALAGLKRYAEAEPFLIAGYEGMLRRWQSVPATVRSQARTAGLRVAEMYEEWGKPELAIEWRRKLAAGSTAALAPAN